jgi:hypothetical protein
MTRYTNTLTGEIITLTACEDGEVLGLSGQGSVLQWDPETGIYDSGETLAAFGPRNLRAHERPRVGLLAASPALLKAYRDGIVAP